MSVKVTKKVMRKGAVKVAPKVAPKSRSKVSSKVSAKVAAKFVGKIPEFVIESGIDLPPSKQGIKTILVEHLERMEPGQSFQIPDDKPLAYYRTNICTYGRRHDDKVFTVRTMPDRSKRCFRIS